MMLLSFPMTNLSKRENSTLKSGRDPKLFGMTLFSFFVLFLNVCLNSWLSYIGLSQYAKYFEEAGMPGSILMTIQPDTIQNDLKITDPNHQLSLMRAMYV